MDAEEGLFAAFFTAFAFHAFFLDGIAFFGLGGFFSIATTTGESHCKCSEGHDQNRFLDQFFHEFFCFIGSRQGRSN